MNTDNKEQQQPHNTISPLLDLLAAYGGSIVSSSSLSPEWINQARASGRMYVDKNGLGFIWEPDIKRIPETVEEVEVFERWYPLKVELPEHLKSFDWLDKALSLRKKLIP